MKAKLVVATLPVLLGISTHAQADKVVGGIISSDTRWTSAPGPYIVSHDLLVLNGATLTIDPGVELRFDPGVRLEIAAGELLARGTAGSPIRFTANVSGPVAAEDRWAQVTFGDGTVDARFNASSAYAGGSIVEHAIIEYAGNSIAQGAIYANAAAPYIAHCIIRDNTMGGVYGFNSPALRLNGNDIYGNSADQRWGGGVYLYSGSDGAELLGNSIHDNAASYGAGVCISFCDNVTLDADQITANYGVGVLIVADNLGLVLSVDPDNPTAIHSNTQGQLYLGINSFGDSYELGGRGNVDARNVWWGTTDEPTLLAGIVDYADDARRGIAFYQPFAIPEPVTLALLALGGLAVVRRRRRYR